jgi:hypothetical protein
MKKRDDTSETFDCRSIWTGLQGVLGLLILLREGFESMDFILSRFLDMLGN